MPLSSPTPTTSGALAALVASASVLASGSGHVGAVAVAAGATLFLLR